MNAAVNTVDAAGQTALMQVVTRGRTQQAPELFSQELETSARMAERYAKPRPGAGTLSSEDTRRIADAKVRAVQARASARRQQAAVLADATREDLAVLRVLVAGGANINARDNKGRTALQLAVQMHRGALAQWLRQAGARA
jgi:ankyrin repeat protein